jgi:hypothetical protein
VTVVQQAGLESYNGQQVAFSIEYTVDQVPGFVAATQHGSVTPFDMCSVEPFNMWTTVVPNVNFDFSTEVSFTFPEGIVKSGCPATFSCRYVEGPVHPNNMDLCSIAGETSATFNPSTGKWTFSSSDTTTFVSG